MTDLDETSLDRRKLLKLTAGGLGVALGGVVIGCGGSAGLNHTSSSSTGGTTGALVDNDYLNFLLNLEYIKAEYYARASTGMGLGSTDTSPSPGTVIGGTAPVPFVTQAVQGLCVNLASDELTHVRALRTLLGSAAVGRPAINFTVGFGAVGAGSQIGTFNPFGDEESFLLGAFYLADVAVTAQYGVQPLLTTPSNAVVAGGLVGTDSYDAGAIRLSVYINGVDAQAKSASISNYRSTLSGVTDQGTTLTAGVPNPAPKDSNGLILARTTAQVLPLLYLGATTPNAGGFFPTGLNGNIK